MLPRIPGLAVVVTLVFAAPGFGRQAFAQAEDKPLFPPYFITTGDSELVAFSLAASPALPFSATIEAENRSTDSAGRTIVKHYRARIARDARGRTRVDTDLNPEGEPVNPQLRQAAIYDPVAKKQIELFIAAKVAVLTREEATPAPKPAKRKSRTPMFLEPPELSGPFTPQPQIDIRREELGTEEVDGMALRHGRESTSYPAGFAGLKEARTTVTDYWYSQELQAFVLVKMVGPGNSEHQLRLQDVKRQDAPKSMFEIPKGYSFLSPEAQIVNEYGGYCPVP